MKFKLFLDDKRDPVGSGWVVCRNVGEAVMYCQVAGIPDFISFDHDLGEGISPKGYDNTGLGFAKWLIDQCLDQKLELPRNFDFYVHSQNPIGAANIRSLLDNFLERIG